MAKRYNIVGVTSSSFTVSGDLTALFKDPDGAGPRQATEFDVKGSVGNDGRYKVLSSALSGGNTVITIIGSVPSTNVSGYITNTTAYRISPADTTQSSIVVFPSTTDNSTPIELVGRDNSNWGESLYSSLYAILENFASPTAPANPVAGLLWFDKTHSALKIFSGGSWLTLSTASVQGASSYVHQQATDATTWNITHNMGTTDLVLSVYVNVGGIMKPIIPSDIVLVDNNNIQVVFSVAHKGKVVLMAA